MALGLAQVPGQRAQDRGGDGTAPEYGRAADAVDDQVRGSALKQHLVAGCGCFGGGSAVRIRVATLVQGPVPECFRFRQGNARQVYLLTGGAGRLDGQSCESERSQVDGALQSDILYALERQRQLVAGEDALLELDGAVMDTVEEAQPAQNGHCDAHQQQRQDRGEDHQGGFPGKRQAARHESEQGAGIAADQLAYEGQPVMDDGQG